MSARYPIRVERPTSVGTGRVAVVLCLLIGLALPLWGAGMGCVVSHDSPTASFVAASDLTEDTVYTSTRDVTGLLVAPDKSVWVTTNGGVLQCAPNGTWRKWTRRDGLPSHEARGARWEAGRVIVAFPNSEAVWDGKAWTMHALPIAKSEVLARALWHGQAYVATADGLQCDAKTLSLPPSSGTHVSALLPAPNALWAALYGDGLWCWNGKWSRAPISLPLTARDVTALAGTPQNLWVGTRRNGVWFWNGSRWSPHVQPDEPFNANVQYIAHWNGMDWVSTLEDGLSARTGLAQATGEQWLHWGREGLSSDAPRHLVAFQNALYVRHGGGQVDALTSQGWQRDVFSKLPRHKVYALASDGRQLYAAQWGGWSAWNGTLDGNTPHWEHHLSDATLANAPIMALLPQSGTLWIATQDRGVLGWQGGKWHVLDERSGLPDDWVTALAAVPPSGTVQNDATQSLLAGTFVGGMAQCDGNGCRVAPELQRENVTALANDEKDGVFVATRRGLWYRDGKGVLYRVNIAWLDSEVQALCHVAGGIWVGTRTSLNFVTDITLHASLHVQDALSASSSSVTSTPEVQGVTSSIASP